MYRDRKVSRSKLKCPDSLTKYTKYHDSFTQKFELAAKKMLDAIILIQPHCGSMALRLEQRSSIPKSALSGTPECYGLPTQGPGARPA